MSTTGVYQTSAKWSSTSDSDRLSETHSTSDRKASQRSRIKYSRNILEAASMDPEAVDEAAEAAQGSSGILPRFRVKRLRAKNASVTESQLSCAGAGRGPRLFATGLFVLCVLVVGLSLAFIRPGRQPLFLAIGDSLTYGFQRVTFENGTRGVVSSPYAVEAERVLRAELATTPYDDIKAVVYGYSGRETTDLLEGDGKPARAALRRAPDTLPRLLRGTGEPVIAAICIGVNDLARNHELRPENAGSAVADRAILLHEIAHENGVQTIAVGVPSSVKLNFIETNPDRAALFEARSAELNGRLADYANDNPLCTYMDYPVNCSAPSDLCDPDNVHLTAKGYDEMGRQIGGVAATVLKARLDTVRSSI